MEKQKDNQITFIFCQRFLTQIMTQNNFKNQTQRMDIRSFYRQKRLSHQFHINIYIHVHIIVYLAIETEHEFIRIIDLLYFLLLLELY